MNEDGSEQPQEQARPRYSNNQLIEMVRTVVSQDPANWGFGSDQDRETSYDFYYGRRPYAMDGNTSDYVSMEVLDSVEGLKAKLLRAFRSSRQVVRFKPDSEQDVRNAQLRTKYVNAILEHGGNPETRGRAYKMLHDVFHDGLLQKMACIKFDFCEEERVDVETFVDQPVEAIAQVAERDDVVRVVIEDETEKEEVVQSQMGPTKRTVKVASGSVQIKRKSRSVDVDVLPPENVFIPRNCINLLDLQELVLLYYKPRYQLYREGYDPKQVDKLPVGSEYSVRNMNRNVSLSRAGQTEHMGKSTHERDMIAVYVGYLQLDMDTPKGEPALNAQLHRIVCAGPEVLRIERVDAINAHFWSPIMQSHRAVGMSIADVTMDIQATVSNTIRGMEDNVHRVNAGIRIADMEVIRNPRDLIDNPIGGIINSPNPQAVNVVPQPQVSAATGGLLEILGLQKEMRTGDTRLGKGLAAQDVITHQNSGDMIDNMINVGNERPLQMARGFAEMCLMPLMQDLYKMGHENKLVIPLEYEGKMVPFDPSQIPFVRDMEIDVALTPEYGQQRAAQLMQTSMLLMQNPAIGPLYTLEEQYALLSEVFQLQGTANWLGDPEDPKVQQRIMGMMKDKQQQTQMQQAIVQKELQLKEREVAAKEAAVGIKHEATKEDLNLKAVMAATKQHLEERRFDWDRLVDTAEIALERQQQRAVGIGKGK